MECPDTYIFGDVVTKCIIPKGSKYYIGEFNNTISYASDTLKYVQIDIYFEN